MAITIIPISKAHIACGQNSALSVVKISDRVITTTVAQIELKETILVVRVNAAKVATPEIIAMGQQTEKMPTLVATPLPPLNWKKTGKTCPNIQKRPQT